MEQRLIDANNLGVGKANPGIFVCKEYAHGWNNALQTVVDDAPTIDPETLPIVRQLREDLAKVTEEKKAIAKDFEEYAHGGVKLCKYCMFDEECEPGETKCDAFGTGVFKYRGPRKEE